MMVIGKVIFCKDAFVVQIWAVLQLHMLKVLVTSPWHCCEEWKL